jgi:hypothetical protein
MILNMNFNVYRLLVCEGHCQLKYVWVRWTQVVSVPPSRTAEQFLGSSQIITVMIALTNFLQEWFHDRGSSQLNSMVYDFFLSLSNIISLVNHMFSYTTNSASKFNRIQKLYTSPSIIWVIKSRIVKWVV